ncbi:hypothetical protein HG531_006874 [Fusarium graminearum]|nr:hypothetical protein HG531_006874 [Fusarium graminearum]
MVGQIVHDNLDNICTPHMLLDFNTVFENVCQRDRCGRRLGCFFGDIKELKVGARPEDGIADVEEISHLGIVAKLEVVLDRFRIANNVNDGVGRCKFSQQALHATLHPRADKNAAGRMSLQSALQDFGLLFITLGRSVFRLVLRTGKAHGPLEGWLKVNNLSLHGRRCHNREG